MTDWPGYLRTFHDTRPGITEDVLTRCRDAQGVTPYRWLVEAVPPSRGPAIELGCGSSPLRPLLSRRPVLGVDRSWGELRVSAERGAAVARADAAAIPARDAVATAVVCSMALMLMSRLEAVLAEIARVLRPGGVLVAIAPTSSPLTGRDLWTYSRLLRSLHLHGLGYPDPLDDLTGRCRAAKLVVTAEERRRFGYLATTEADVDLFLRGLYLPGVADSAIQDSRVLLRRTLARRGRLELGLPIRRIVVQRAMGS